MASVSFNNSSPLSRHESPLARARDENRVDLFDIVLRSAESHFQSHAAPPAATPSADVSRERRRDDEPSAAPESRGPNSDEPRRENDDPSSAAASSDTRAADSSVDDNRSAQAAADADKPADPSSADAAGKDDSSSDANGSSDKSEDASGDAAALDTEGKAAATDAQQAANQAAANNKFAKEIDASTKNGQAAGKSAAADVVVQEKVADEALPAEHADEAPSQDKLVVCWESPDDTDQQAGEKKENVQKAPAQPTPQVIGAGGNAAAGEVAVTTEQQGSKQATARDENGASRKTSRTSHLDRIAPQVEPGAAPRTAANQSLPNPTSPAAGEPPTAALAAGVENPPPPAPRAPAGGEAAPGESLSGRLPRHLVARNGEASSTKGLQNGPDQARFLSRVARAIETAQQRGGEIRLRLSPPELGSLRLEVKLQNGVLTARVEAETTIARDALLENLPVLRERLAEQGVRIEQFDVDLLDRQFGQAADGRANGDERHAQNESQAQRSAEQQSEENAANEESAAAASRRGPDNDGALDVIV